MKHLKHFESKSDMQFHLEQIEDLFMDVVDEFGIYKRDSEEDYGLFYNITIIDPAKWAKWYQGSSGTKYIRVWIANLTEDPGPYKLDGNIKHSKVLRDFENRLRSIGYVIDRGKGVEYYEINIYLDNKRFENLKQLESSENSQNEYYLDLTKSIFQEVIDEFDLYENKSFFDDPSTYEIEPLVYAVGKKKTKPNIVQFEVKMPYKSQAEDIAEYIKDNILPRLNNMNCEILSSGDYKIYQSNLFAYFIVIEFPVSFTSHSRKRWMDVVEGRNAFMRDKLQLESRQSDTQFHMDQINDLFMDVVDELGVHRRTAQVLADWDDDNTGLFYNIERWDQWRDPQVTKSIRLWFGEFHEGVSIPFSGHLKGILESKLIKDFESRLKNIGYIIKVQRADFYGLIISYDNI